MRACPVIEDKEAASTASASNAITGSFIENAQPFDIMTINSIISIKTVCHLIALRSIYSSQTAL
jgi:hypothetical protein